MEITLDIPDPLYDRTAGAALECGVTVRALVLIALKNEIGDASSSVSERPQSYWADRKILPEFQRVMKSGEFTRRPKDKDVTELISDDRDGR